MTRSRSSRRASSALCLRQTRATHAKRTTQSAAYAVTSSVAAAVLLGAGCPGRPGTSSRGRSGVGCGCIGAVMLRSSCRVPGRSRRASARRRRLCASSRRVRAQSISAASSVKQRKPPASAIFMSGCCRPAARAGDDHGVLPAPLLHAVVDDGQVGGAEDAERRREAALARAVAGEARGARGTRRR